MNPKKQISNRQSLAISIGLVYLWFGVLKFFPGLSPADDLAKNTIDWLTFSLISPNLSIILLAIWETAVGLLLIVNIYRRPIIILALVHIAFTFTPLFIFHEQSFTNFPYGLTMLGQYIVKNIIIAGALFSLYELSTTKHIALSARP